ncbi:MAG: glycosyltransferase, partial [Janthinobacterium lividum]
MALLERIDSSPDIPVMINHIEHLGRKFKDYRIIIFENDSIDGTKEMLSRWRQENSKIRIISHDYKNTKRPSIKFLADTRNYYIKALEEYAEYINF